MPRYFTDAELDRLRLLRTTFLSYELRPGAGDEYWESEDQLRLYDETFARRIAWKWEAVLGELALRGRLPGGKTVLDWGCGTGVAARAFLAAQEGVAGQKGVERVHLVERSPLALAFAAKRVRDEHPGVQVVGGEPAEAPDVLLVSHVLDELDEPQREALLALAARAGAVLWVEPGNRHTSRALGEARARLAATMDVLAPCTHQAACGALAKPTDWCHFFARAPQEVYIEGHWAELGRELGIDLRSLPYSFLALARRGAFELAGPGARLIARPRLTRGKAEVEVCDAQGLHDLDFLQRVDKQMYKELDDVAGEPWLFDATIEGRRLKELKRRER